MDVTSLVQEAGVSVGTLTATTVLRTIFTFVVGVVIINVLTGVIDRALDKTQKAGRFKKQILSTLKTAMNCLLLLIVLDSLGVKVTSFVALMSVAAFALTLALQTTLSNIAGGLTNVATQPFSIGDYVSIGGTEGSVSEIMLSRTKLTTLDNREVIIPNSTVANAIIINFNRLGKRRMDIEVSASYDSATADVYAALWDAIGHFPQILKDPEPETHITGYGASSIGYIARVWVLPQDYWTVWFGMIETVRVTFAERGVEMTYDHLNVHFDHEDPRAN